MVLPTDIGWWVTQLGVPGVICFMIWRILVFFKPIIIDFIPYFKGLITGHISLISTLEEQAKNGLITLKSLETNQADHGKLLTMIHDKVKDK